MRDLFILEVLIRLMERIACRARLWICLAILFPLFSFLLPRTLAQTRQEWRDSLETLSASLRQAPDNIDLRLRKAEADIQLEQWTTEARVP